MAITITQLSPTLNAVDVPLSSEIVIRVQSTVALGGSIFDISVTEGLTFTAVMSGLGTFLSGWTGEVIDNDPGNDRDYTIVVHRPGNNHKFFEGLRITTTVEVENTLPETVIVDLFFETEFFKLKRPAVYSETLVLTSLPAGWTSQTSGTGAPPTFGGGGMETTPGAAGQSFIRKTPYGLNFTSGVLVDIDATKHTVSAVGILRAVRIFKGGVGSISLFIDFNNLEAWISDVDSIPPTSYRVGIKDNTGSTFFRLAVKGTPTTLVARLYAGRFGFDQTPTLQLTSGPSNIPGTSEDLIEIGSIDTGSFAARIVGARILNNSDPDAHYPFPVISSITPADGVVTGGERIKAILSRKIDVGLGGSIFRLDSEVRNESTGSASSSVAAGIIQLTLSGIGTAAARYLYSLSGDRPSAADVSIDLDVGQSIIDSPPQTEAVLGAVEFRANGVTLAIELAASLADGAFFRAVATTGGTTTLNNRLINTTQSGHTIRFVRVDNQIIAFINGQRVLTTALADGPGILRFYSRSTVALNHVTTFNNLQVRPVLRVGTNIMT